MQRFDIHSHILPKIDDGSQSWDETMDMARQAWESGTTDLAVTHHIINNADYAREGEIIEKFDELKTRLRAAQIPLNLHLGAEIYYQFDMELSHRISTYNNNGKYFLVEFPMREIPRAVDEKFFDFVMDGKIPILAHPERYLELLQNPDRAYEFVQRGVLLQLNAGSLVGQYGGQIREFAINLLEARLIHFVGSDGHNTTRRPIAMDEAYEMVQERWGEKVTTQLFRENPARMLRGEDIKVPEPYPVQAPKKHRIGLLKRWGLA